MQLVNIHEAKTNLSKLLEMVYLSNKEIIIAKAGKPVAKLISYKEVKTPRKPGLWKDKIWMADDFNDEDEEMNRMFYGGK